MMFKGTLIVLVIYQALGCQNSQTNGSDCSHVSIVNMSEYYTFTKSYELQLNKNINNSSKQITLIISEVTPEVSNYLSSVSPGFAFKINFTQNKNSSLSKNESNQYNLKGNATLKSNSSLIILTDLGIFGLSIATLEEKKQNPQVIVQTKQDPITIPKLKGKYSYFYNEEEQKTLFYVAINIFTILLYFMGLNRGRYRQILSRSMDTLLIFTEIVIRYEIRVQQNSEDVYLKIISWATLLFKFIVCAFYYQTILMDSHEDHRMRQIAQVIVMLISSTLFAYTFYIPILILLFLDDARQFIQHKLYDPQYRIIMHIQFTITLAILPAFRLIFDLPSKGPFTSDYFLWISLFAWIYVFLFIEVAYNGGAGLLFRKGKWMISKKYGVYKSILFENKIKNEVSVCMVCYSYLDQQDVPVIGSCEHKFHQTCVVGNKISICPVDQSPLNLK